jgi:hypothetical protein
VRRDRELPQVFVGRTDAEDAAEQAGAARTLTPEQRARVLEELCRMAAELTAQQPNPQRVLDWQDPVPPESMALLARLRERHRRGG